VILKEEQRERIFGKLLLTMSGPKEKEVSEG
jgi:hypothetical protein